MSAYTLPVTTPAPAAEPNTVYTVASGDLRPSANVTCWPAQRQFEEHLDEAFSVARLVRPPRPRGGRGGRPRLHRQPARWASRCSARSRRTRRSSSPRRCGSTATTCSPGLRDPPRADPHRRQLERAVARPGRHAQPQRHPHQGGRRVLDAVERGLHRRVGARRAAHLARDGQPRRTTPATSATSRRCPAVAEAELGRALAAPAAGARRRSWASSTRAAWACTTRSSPTSCSTRRRLQGAAVAERARRRDGRRSRDAEAQAVRELARRRRHEVPHRHRRGDRAHRRPDARAVQDVHRRAAHRRRLRLDAVGIQYQQGLKDSCPRATWSKACSTTSTARRCSAATATASCTPGEPLPHFNEVDECAGVDGLITNRSGPRWASTPRTRCTTSAGARSTTGRVRLGLRDLRPAPAVAPRRLRQARGASASRRCTSRSAAARSRASQAGRDRLDPGLHRGRRAAHRPRPRQRRRAARGGDRAPLDATTPAVADHARGATASPATR